MNYDSLPDIAVSATRNIISSSMGSYFPIKWVIKKFPTFGSQIQSEFSILDDIKIQFILFFLKDDPKSYVQTTIYQLKTEIVPKLEFVISNFDKTKNISVTHSSLFTPDSNRHKFSLPISYSDICESTGFLENGDLTINIHVYHKPLVAHFVSETLTKKRRLSSDIIKPTFQKIDTTNINSNVSTTEKVVNLAPITKANCGYVGLLNQGATCYMNSMLQSLFHIPAFRRLVFNLQTTGTEDAEKSIPLNLQRLFCRLQISERACPTKTLTTSFGWTTRETIMQHDVQEFCRVLLNNLETKLQGTDLSLAIAKLFRGRIQSFIRCLNVDFDSSREEFFYDISLPIKGCADINEAFGKYVEMEILNGNNQYSTEEYGMQDAEMGLEFVEFPKILHIHLGRFEFDYETLRMMKNNERLEFPTEIDLSNYLKPSERKKNPELFELFGVLVHSGGVYGGHYYAFLRTTTEKQWFKFNDSNVTKEDAEKAIDDNFGGNGKYYNAYMLVYVKKEDIESVFETIPDETIPQHLIDFVKNEEEEEKIAKEEQIHQSNSITVSTLLEDVIERNSLSGRFGFRPKFEEEKILYEKTMTLNGLYEKIAEKYGKKTSEIRLWETKYNRNPTRLVNPSDTTTLAAINMTSCPALDFFVQFKDEDEELDIGEGNAMIYVKFFFPDEKCPFQYIGHQVITRSDKVESILPKIRAILGFGENTDLIVFQELTNLNTKQLKSDDTFISQSVGNGSILVFQVPPGNQIPKTCFQIKEVENIKNDENNIEKKKTINGIEINGESKCGEKEEKEEKEEEDNVILLDFRDYIPDIKFDTVDFYINIFTNVADFDIYDLEHGSKPLFRLHMSTFLSFPQLKKIISVAANLNYNPENDSILLYKGTSKNNLPTNPMDTKMYSSPRIYFQCSPSSFRFKYHRLYFHLMKGINEAVLEDSSQYTVQFSSDGYNVDFAKKVIALKKSTCFEIIQKTLKNEGVETFSKELKNADNLRFMQIYDSKICAFLEATHVFQSAYYTLRVDVIPDDQKCLDEENSEFLLPVCFGYVDSSIINARAKGCPFLLKVIKGEKFVETKARLLKCIKKNEESNDFLFRLKEDAKFLGSDVVLSDVTSKNSLLFVIAKGDLNPVDTNVGSRAASQPIKIYN